MSKYKNQKCEYDGITFDSKRELARYCELKILLKAGAIRNLYCQKVYELVPACDIGEARKKAPIRYKADFYYVDTQTNCIVIEDVKSPATRKTAAFRLKKHLMAWRHGIIIKEVA